MNNTACSNGLCGLLYPAALGYKILGQESSVTKLQRISYYTTVFSYHKAINLEGNQKNFFINKDNSSKCHKGQRNYLGLNGN